MGWGGGVHVGGVGVGDCQRQSTTKEGVQVGREEAVGQIMYREGRPDSTVLADWA